MSRALRPRTSRRRTIVAAVLLLSVLLGAWFMAAGARYLQHEDPLQRADAIFVLAGTRAERPLEAVELYQEGDAASIVLSPGRTELAGAAIYWDLACPVPLSERARQRLLGPVRSILSPRVTFPVYRPALEELG